MRPLRFRASPPSFAEARAAVLGPHIHAPLSSTTPLSSTIALWRQPWAGPRHRAGDQLATLGTDHRVAALLSQRFGADEEAWRIARDSHGRPTLAAEHGLDLSISHAGNCWILAVSGGGRRIGVDIEAPRELPRVLALAERYFPASELALLDRLAPNARPRAFLRLWCAREAILKAHGRGIAFGLSRLSLDLTPTRVQLLDCDPELGAARDWRLREFVPQHEMIGMLAWRGPPAVVRGWVVVVGDSGLAQ